MVGLADLPTSRATAFTQVEFTLLFIEFRGAAEFSFCAKREGQSKLEEGKSKPWERKSKSGEGKS
jgi:hypothetical protein